MEVLPTLYKFWLKMYNVTETENNKVNQKTVEHEKCRKYS